MSVASDSAGTAVLEEYFRAVQDGDRARLSAIFAPNISYTFPGRSSFARTYSGHDEIFGYLDRLGALTAGTLTIEVDWLFANETGGVARARPRATRFDGVELEWTLILEFKLNARRIAAIRLYYADQYEIDAFLDPFITSQEVSPPANAK